MRELVTPDRKKYAAYYQALEEHVRLENEWYEEDQRNLITEVLRCEPPWGRIAMIHVGDRHTQ